MELRQRTELRRLLAPSLRQSLKILAMPLIELKAAIEEELTNNPLLEERELQAPEDIPDLRQAGDNYSDLSINKDEPGKESSLNLVTQKISLSDILLRQLGMSAKTDEDFSIGKELIGNIDENGYLTTAVDEIAHSLNVTKDKVEQVLKIIQTFEPAGIGARTVSECLLIQLDLNNEKDALLRKIIESHIEDVAKKNFKYIARSLKIPQEQIKPLIKKILKLNPKPGLKLASAETRYIIPDIVIDENGDNLEVTINNEYIPRLNINKVYLDMLKKSDLDPKTREFITGKLRSARELLKAISKRQSTLRRVVETIVYIQKDALKQDLSLLKPLTMKEIASKLNLNESTVCRVIINKYVKTPSGTACLKDFFPSSIGNEHGKCASSNYIKKLIKDSIEQEDKKHPLSDEDIVRFISTEKNLKVSRRAITKYRQELKILSSAFRKER